MNLYEYLLDRISDGGYAPSDISFLTWNTGIEYLDGTTWVPVSLPAFVQVARQVQANRVTPQARERIRFHMKDDAVFQWVNAQNDFIRVDNLPRSVTLTAQDLTT